MGNKTRRLEIRLTEEDLRDDRVEMRAGAGRGHRKPALSSCVLAGSSAPDVRAGGPFSKPKETRPSIPF